MKRANHVREAARCITLKSSLVIFAMGTDMNSKNVRNAVVAGKLEYKKVMVAIKQSLVIILAVTMASLKNNAVLVEAEERKDGK